MMIVSSFDWLLNNVTAFGSFLDMMNLRITWMTGLAVTGVVFCLFLPACKKHINRTTQDLESAGYQLTPQGFVKALEAGDTRVLRLFATQDTDLESISGITQTPLHITAENNHVEASEFFT